jgi:DNA-binding response OmpR family regulator
MARILVIDDDELVRFALTDILEEGGYTVLSPGDCKDALAYALRESYDLLLTDIFLPTIPGWDLIQSVRRERPQLPVIAISGGGMAVQADLALKISELTGADFVLPKPMDARCLLATVEKALKRSDPN